MSFAGAVGSGGGSGGAGAGGVAQPPDGNRASDPSTPPPTATSAANVSQSVPVHADWDKFSLSLFAAHPQHSDSEEDDLSRMVDHLVAEDASPTLSVEDAYSESFNEYARFAQGNSVTVPRSNHNHVIKYVGKLISSDAKSFSNTPYLFQSTSAAYHQHFPKPSPANNQTIQHSNSNSNTPANTINKFDSDDLTFDINDIDLDPMSFNGMNVTGIHPNQFGQPQSHLNGRSSILHPHSSHFPPLSSSAQNGKSGKSGPNSGANSSEQTPTSTFKALRQSINNTNGLIPELQLPNGGPGTLPLAPQSHHSRYSSCNNTSTQQKYGASPSYQLNQFSFSSSFNSSLAQPGTSPVLINSYVGSGNAMRPNGLIGTSAGSNGITLLSSSFDAASSTVNGFQGGTSPVGTSNLLGVANGPNASVAASYHGPQVLKSMGSNGRLDASARGLGIIGVDAKSSGSGTASPGMLLPPGRVVGGMVLGNPGVARSELAEDGCPVLKVPRMPFLGVPGTMEIPHRVWKKGGTEKPDNRHFMIMTYNVLAPMYCTDSRYHKTGEKDLDWDHRKTLILDEIAFYSPDFICLQV
ncbi:hypothetical protein BC830DRAFT_87344 [Chytriomyces sp. MP71]|nr:hypothetical protein BC830DRAFT_87344 [Chytriomyces sp. MP71]